MMMTWRLCWRGIRLLSRFLHKGRVFRRFIIKENEQAETSYYMH